MSRLRTILFGIVVGILVFFSIQFFLSERSTLLFISKQSVQTDVKRIGIDLGKWNPWCASQYMSNVLFNPGFEAGISRTILNIEKIDHSNLYQKDEFLEHFWDGTPFEVLTGPSTGQKGVIITNVKEKELTSYKIHPDVKLESGDSLVLTKIETGETPINWWVPDEVRHLVTVDPKEARPNSPGTQSAKLILEKGMRPHLSFYLDLLSERSGNMLPVNGEWKLSFWAKGKGLLKATFFRGPLIFLEKTVDLSEEWKDYSFDFEGRDEEKLGPLCLTFEAIGDVGTVWIDDVSLSESNNILDEFRKIVEKMLLVVKPGILRNWQGQLGNPFSNSLGSDFERKPNRYKMGAGDFEYDFLYGLDQFIGLCKRLGATPWIVMPPAYTQEEIIAFGTYLKDKGPLYIEFGNELWNPIYHAGQPKKAFERSKYAFAILEKIVPNATLLSSLEQVVSPFFLTKLNLNMTDSEIMKDLFSPYSVSVKNKYIAETNLHTLGGTATPQQRNVVVASKAAGLGLANHLLSALSDQSPAMCVFKFAGYEFVDPKRTKGFHDAGVHLFGIVRDLSRLRPQGVAIGLLNQVMAGEFYPFVNGADLEGGAFIHEGSLSLVISSSSPEERTFRIKLPKNIKLPTKLLQMSGKLFDSNEEKERVRMIEQTLPKISGDEVQIVVPAYALLILK